MEIVFGSILTLRFIQKGDINLLHYYKRPSPHFIIIMSINLSVLLKYKKGNIDKKLDYKSIKGST